MPDGAKIQELLVEDARVLRPSTGSGREAGPVKQLGRTLAKRKALTLAMVLAPLLLISSLGNKAFWIDESINAVLGENILSFGYPTKWDGSYLEEPYFNVEATRGVVEITHCWLQYYLTAASLGILGRTTVAARLPFAVLGMFSVLCMYFLALRLSGSEMVAGLSALLLTLHTGFLIYSRLCRYFSPTFFLMLVLLLQYLRWQERPSRRNLCVLTLVSVLLFYTHYPIWPFLMCSIWIHFLVSRFSKAEQAARTIRAQGMPAIRRTLVLALVLSTVTASVLAVPWVLYAKPYDHDIPDWSGASYIARLSMFAWKLNTWVFPWFGLAVVGGVTLLVGRLVRKRPNLAAGSRIDWLLLAGIPLYLVVVILARHPMFSSQYTALAIPFAMLVSAQAIAWMRQSSRLIASATLALLMTTNVLQAMPFAIVERLGINPRRLEPLMINPRAQFNRGTPLDHYIYEQLSIRSYLFEYLYYLSHEYRHRLQSIVSYVQRNARPDETILAPWHDADALRFYTGARVVYHFKPSFTVDRVKRLVYRPDTTIDWVVPNAFYEPDSPFFKYDPRDYERVYLEGPKDYIYENEPNLDFFMWRTNLDAPQSFFILRRKKAGGEFRAVQTSSSNRSTDDSGSWH